MSEFSKKPCAVCGTRLNPSNLTEHENKCFDKIHSKHELYIKSKENLSSSENSNKVKDYQTKSGINKTNAAKEEGSLGTSTKSTQSNLNTTKPGIITPVQIKEHSIPCSSGKISVGESAGSDPSVEIIDIPMTPEKAQRQALLEEIRSNKSKHLKPVKSIKKQIKHDISEKKYSRQDVQVGTGGETIELDTDSSEKLKSDRNVEKELKHDPFNKDTGEDNRKYENNRKIGELDSGEEQQNVIESKLCDKELLESSPYPQLTKDGENASVDATPYLFCRVCGTRYRSDEVDQHEKMCLEKSKGKDQTWLETDAPSNIYLDQALSNMSIDKNKDDTDKEIDEIENAETGGKYQQIQKLPSKLTSLEHLDEEKREMVETPYPSPSSTSENDNQARQSRSTTPRLSSISGENPKQAWNANAKQPLSAKVEMPKPTQKYRHYPVSCEFCNEKFQPGDLRKHIQKYHADAHLPEHLRSNDKGIIHPPDEEKPRTKVKKGGGPRFKICYICGRQYGSKSLPIHEPKCLGKWRLQNNQLPPEKRMPEPVKPETSTGSAEEVNLPGSGGYSNQLPEWNEENEAAYRSHLKNLVPCSFCGRRFNPDRIMIHENACIERPKKRQYITPDENEKK